MTLRLFSLEVAGGAHEYEADPCSARERRTQPQGLEERPQRSPRQNHRGRGGVGGPEENLAAVVGMTKPTVETGSYKRILATPCLEV